MTEEPQSKFQRLNLILTRLGVSAGVGTAELAQVCAVDQRTIQRDIAELRSYHYPIEDCGADDKMPRYRLLNLRTAGTLLDLEETLALSLTIPLTESTGLGAAARRGWEKLHYAVLNGQERSLKNELPNVLSSQFGWSISPEIMQQLGLALVESRRVRILYQGLREAQPRWRCLEPWQMFFQERWYLRALDTEKQQARTFRPDRIQELELLGETFPKPPSLRLEDPHFHKWDLSEAEPVTLRFQVSESLARWLTENPVHSSQVLEGLEFSLTVRDVDALLRWVLGLSYCKVLEPEWVRLKLRERAQAVLDW